MSMESWTIDQLEERLDYLTEIVDELGEDDWDDCMDEIEHIEDLIAERQDNG